MKKQTAPDLLEIVFSGRNRAYGAYALRRAYPNNLAKALAGSFLLLLALVFLPRLLRAFSQDAYKAPPDFGTIIMTPRKEVVAAPKPLPKPMTPAPKASTQAFPPPKVLSDELVDDIPMANIDDLLANPAQIGGTNQIGDPDAPPSLDEQPNLGAIGNEAKRQIQPDTIFTQATVQIQPYFPGGEPELLRYLAEHIRYPDMARTGGIEGIVAIGFVVDEQGDILDARILKEIGGSCGTEALRVVKDMPRWRPGEVNGKSVKVRFTLPVRFVLK
ncbi:MAG: TonB family protein [Lewinellaceae bacterium]|nr:TonB family protein [Lewinellaceae bacterium]